MGFIIIIFTNPVMLYHNTGVLKLCSEEFPEISTAPYKGFLEYVIGNIFNVIVCNYTYKLIVINGKEYLLN